METLIILGIILYAFHLWVISILDIAIMVTNEGQYKYRTILPFIPIVGIIYLIALITYLLLNKKKKHEE